MAVNPMTPGVYIDEIPVFPASVAGVSTAIPAFIGYVEYAKKNGASIALNTAVRISSIMEYETYFGKSEYQPFTIAITDDVNVTPNTRTIAVTKGTESLYRMYYNIQMYFSNGGGPCYIVPVGLYSAGSVSKTNIKAGLDGIAKEDEPTLLVMPDAVSLGTPADIGEVHDYALAQCQNLKDRFTIMDVKSTGAAATDAGNFRGTGVGIDNLKYGASYYPYLNTTLNYRLDENSLRINTHTTNNPSFTRATLVLGYYSAIDDAILKTQQGLAKVSVSVAALATTDVASSQTFVNTAITALKTANDDTNLPAALKQTTAINTANAYTLTAGDFFTGNGNYLTNPQTAPKGATLIAAYNTLLGSLQTIRTTANTAFYNPTNAATLSGYVAGTLTDLKTLNTGLYNTILAKINLLAPQVGPCGAMAGIYARVDGERGVWKAPANVGVRGISGPSVNITNAEQDGLNIDATSGKSINAIRSFTGRGTVVWGARTLAGNDNEWRYVNVRRFFNYAEESIQKATAFVVFEPNTANTWQRVKGMIEAFLTNEWRQGALAGATAKEAFFVRVGLGVTMSADDILNGRMIVEVGMAAVRPAEFIILKFQHKLQES
jgi:uncharacterized protein